MFKQLKKLLSGKTQVDTDAEILDDPHAITVADAFATHVARTERETKAIIASPFLVTPSDFKVKAADGEQVAMDSNITDSGKSAYVLGQTRIPDALLGWYVSQTFIGYQTCSLIAQNWLVDRACSLKGRDAARNGFKIIVDEGIDISPEQIKTIERLDKKFKLKKNLVQADKFKNVHGIRHVLFKIKGMDYEKPFNPDGIKPGSYQGMSQIDPYWFAQELSADDVADPSSVNFYNPEYWVISGQRIHRSHFVILRGPEVSDILKPSYQYGGLSLAQLIFERVYAAERTANEAPQLVMTKRLNVRKMDLDKVVANPGTFQKALAAMVKFRDNFGVLAIGKDEDYSQLETALADLDHTISSQYQLVSSIAGVPVTKLMKSPPRGFQSTGENEREDYHEELESIQENDLSPIIERHHLCLMRSEIEPEFNLGEFEINHEWNELSVLTEVEKADIADKKSQTAQRYLEAGAVDPYDIRNGIITDELSGFTGMEAIDRPEDEPDMVPLDVIVEEIKQDGEPDGETAINEEA